MTGERADARVAVLGAGSIAQVVHLPILDALPTARLAGICDLDRSKAAALAGRFAIPRVYRTDEEAFEDDEVDAIVICTPSHQHEAQAVAALEAGKHVLVEKPLAFDAEGAARVVAAAERTGRGVMVALNNRYRPDVLAVTPFARGGELGELFFVKAGWLNRKMRTVRPTWRHRRATAGGGALMDLGVQILDLALWLLDYPRIERLVAHIHPGEGMEVEDAATVLLWVRNGPLVSIEVTWSLLAQRDRHFLQVLGTNGSASISPLAVYKELEHGLLDVTPHVAPGRENLYTASYRQQLGHFVEVARGAAAADPPREQAELMRLVALAYRSAEEGRELEA